MNVCTSETVTSIKSFKLDVLNIFMELYYSIQVKSLTTMAGSSRCTVNQDPDHVLYYVQYLVELIFIRVNGDFI